MYRSHQVGKEGRVIDDVTEWWRDYVQVTPSRERSSMA